MRIVILQNRTAIIRACGLERSGAAARDYLEPHLVAEQPPIGVRPTIIQVSKHCVKMLNLLLKHIEKE